MLYKLLYKTIIKHEKVGRLKNIKVMMMTGDCPSSWTCIQQWKSTISQYAD